VAIPPDLLHGRKPPEIIVVNPAITKTESSTAKRYQSMFRGCKIHGFSTLESFRQKGLRLLKNN